MHAVIGCDMPPGPAHLDAVRQAQGLPALPARLHLGEILWAMSARPTGWTSPPSAPRLTSE